MSLRCVCVHVCKEGSLRNANKTQQLTQRLLEELGIPCLLFHPWAVVFLQLHCAVCLLSAEHLPFSAEQVP